MISAADLAKKKFEGIAVPGYSGLLGTVPPDVSIVIWGPKGSLKSTMAIDMANQLAVSLGSGIYCSSEEGSGPSLQNKITRLGATNPNLQISDYDNLDKLKSEIELIGAKFVIIDSISMGYIKPNQFRRFMEFCKQNNVILIYILHATKEGNYKGPTEYVHWPDVEIKAVDGVAETEKNRFKETPQSMRIASTKPSRKNPVNNPKIPSVGKDEFGSYRDISDLKDKALRWTKNNLSGTEIINKEKGIPIKLSWQNLKKAAGSYYTINKLLSLKKLPNLLKEAHFIKVEPDNKKRKGIKAWYKFESPIYINGIKHTAYLAVKENQQGKFYYDHSLIKIEKPGGISGSPSKKDIRQPSPGSSSNIQNSSKNSKKGHANTERDNPKNGRRRGRNKAGHVPQRENPVRSFSDPLVYLGKALKVIIDAPEGQRVLKWNKEEGKLPMFASLKKGRLYILPAEYVKRVSGKVHSASASDSYQEWNGYDANKWDYQIEWPRKGTKTIDIGTAAKIYYESDKIMKSGDRKGKSHYYVHEFDKRKRPASVLGHVLVISNIKIDERGILN